MTRTQALNTVAVSHTTAREHASIVTAAHYRYFVRTADGTAMLDASSGKVIETDNLSFALSARNACNGILVDRWQWRNN